MAADARLSLRICHGRSEATVIEASGEIDLASAPRLRGELLAAVACGTAVLDTADVAFCDGSGVRALMEAECSARDHGAAFRLAGPSEAIARVLEIAGLIDAFEIFPDVETALKD